MSYHIAVCDDNETDIRYLTSLVRSWAENAQKTVSIDAFSSAEAFLFHYEEQKDYQILLLDIEMGAMDGVTMAKTLRKNDQTVQIIFITGYSDYIAEGYDVAALHYLMKPVKPEKLFQVLDRAVEKLAENDRMLTLTLPGETIRIPLYSIRYLEVQQNYVTIHTGDQESCTVKKTLGEFEDLLDDRFFRTGRSFLVNLTFIRKVTRTEIHLSDGSVLPLPRGQYEKLNRAIISMN